MGEKKGQFDVCVHFFEILMDVCLTENKNKNGKDEERNRKACWQF